MNWIEEYLFKNDKLHYKLLSFLLLPFTLLYCLIILVKKSKKRKKFNIPIISVGNIIVGGSGKTPFTIALCNNFHDKKIVVILRGYKRKSQGLVKVSDYGKILVDVDMSGDEAMEIALSTKATVIVSENREKAILEAEKLGADFVILDDGWSKNIEKFDIVIKKEFKNKFCLPSGPYRDFSYKGANLIVEDGKDFDRIVSVPKIDDFVLVSAISNPERLLNFVKTDKYKFFIDHYDFKQEDIEEIKKEFGDVTILTTMKDYVKLRKFNLKLEIIVLKFELKNRVIKEIEEYLSGKF